MNWPVILLACMIITVSCHSKQTDSLQQRNPGFFDWLFGSSSTVVPTSSPTEKPKECPTCQCGIARTRRRIVGGYETKELEFPWMAVLMYSGRFYCGGSLVNDLYVLTAAHCTAGFNKDRISVRFLEHDRSMKNETKTIDRNISRIIRHQRYNPGTYDNDIALLKLSQRVDLSSALKRRARHNESEGTDGEDGEDDDNDDVGLRPVCLPTSQLSYSNYTGVVAGWGTTSEGGQVSNALQEVSVPIISNEDCRKSAYKNRITDNMLCAGESDGGRDACQGDSGGPLHILNTTNAQFQEVGVVSWGEGCARPDRPGVYSRVNRYLTWIKSNTKDACYC